MTAMLKQLIVERRRCCGCRWQSCSVLS